MTLDGAAPAEAGRDEVQRLLEQGAQLVEVLPRDQYEWAHLPTAIDMPIERFAEADRIAATLDRARTVVVYCNDLQ